VLWTLLAFACLKAAILIYYVAKNHGLGGPVVRKDTLAAQLRQAVPFAASGTLHGVRVQGDQWIAAAMFSVTQFASFSVATVLAPLVQIFRQSVNNVFLPSMSRMQSEGDYAGMLALNSRANCMVGLLVYPLLAFAFVFAEHIITLIYTATYLDAVPVLRLYTLGLVAFVVELVSTLFVLRQGPFAAWANGLVLLIALPLSIFGAMHFGLVGAAMGSVAAIYAERALSLQRIAKLTGTPIRKLQDWGALAGLLGAAILSAGVAWLALFWSEWSTLATLLAGATIMAATYPAALYLTGRWGDLVTFVAALRHKAVVVA
jgi:O-antigen/teichoic acid export membrane protein